MKRHTYALLLVALLAGCSSVAPRTAPPTMEQADKSAQAKPAPAPAKKGGYYLDDGPGDNPPPNLDAIPDAVPRAEAPLERANRPYVALGTRFTPMTAYQPYKATGVSTWYGRRYHGNKTSSGEIYDMYAMTAAHPTLPIPSYARVTSVDNGRSVVVRINDRGPFLKDRLIDLSYAAAHRLRLTEKGSGMVTVEAINTGAAPAAAAAPATAAAQPGVFVQLGAFRDKLNADQLRQRVMQQNLAQNVDSQNWYNGGIYRVRLGPYASRAEAERAADSIERALSMPTLVIIQ